MCVYVCEGGCLVQHKKVFFIKMAQTFFFFLFTLIFYEQANIFIAIVYTTV